jgi:hypothetical protein
MSCKEKYYLHDIKSIMITLPVHTIPIDFLKEKYKGSESTTHIYKELFLGTKLFRYPIYFRFAHI